jgi:Na+/proline symporter
VVGLVVSGAEPGGGGYIAQRIFSAKSENDSLLATLFFNVAHYALRPWPWILVALAALVLYPHGVRGPDGKVDPELGYIQAMIDYLPAWLRGLMMAGFLAAYMSTIGTHLNLGASYLTNDIYRRFVNRQRERKPLRLDIARRDGHRDGRSPSSVPTRTTRSAARGCISSISPRASGS